MLSIIIPLLICFKLYIKIEEGWGSACSEAGDIWAHQGWRVFFLFSLFYFYLYIYFLSLSSSLLLCNLTPFSPPLPGKAPGSRLFIHSQGTPSSAGTWTLAQPEFLGLHWFLSGDAFSTCESLFSLPPPHCLWGRTACFREMRRRFVSCVAPCCVTFGMLLCLFGHCSG